jgi:hypothetical protein
MGFGSSFKKVVGKTISAIPGGEKAADLGLLGATPFMIGSSSVDAYNKSRRDKGLPDATPEQITTANLFKNLSPEQQKDLLLNNPNIEGPGGRQIYDPLTNTVRIEESEFQSGQRGRQEALARSLSEQLQGVELQDTDPTSRFEQGRELLEPAFTEQREQLEQSLADRGLPAGSEAYARELDRLQQSQGRQLQQLSFESVQTAEAQRSARFNELASLLGQAQVGGVGFGQFQPQYSGLDLFGAEQGQLNRAFQGEQMRKQRSADRQAALIGGLGQVGGAAIGAFAASDERLKEDIEKIGESKSGINIYTFRYKDKPEVFQGVIAQEIQEINPEAVIEKDGFLAVNYDLIDVEFKEHGDK